MLLSHVLAGSNEIKAPFPNEKKAYLVECLAFFTLYCSWQLMKYLVFKKKITGISKFLYYKKGKSWEIQFISIMWHCNSHYFEEELPVTTLIVPCLSA